MIALILGILRILLYIILGILGLALLLIFLILFVPIRYRFLGEKYDDINAAFKISYLLHILGAKAVYDGNLIKVKVKLLFFTLYSFEKVLSEEEKSELESMDFSLDAQEMDVDEFIDLLKEEKNKEKERKEETKKDNNADKIERTEKCKNPDKQKEDFRVKDKKAKGEDSAVEFKSKDSKSEKDREFAAKNKKKNTEKGEKQAKIKAYWIKFKEVYAFLKKEENENLFSFVFKKIYKILKAILPKRLKGDLEFGLKDPDMTGYVLALFSLFYTFTSKNFSLTADFTKAIIKGRLKFRGRILVVEILYYAILILLDKRVRRLIAELRPN